jgi:cell division protein FtsB
VKRLLLIPALVGVVIVYAVFDSDSGIRFLLQVRENVAVSNGRIAVIRSEVEALKREAIALESDEFAIESAIREDLGLARPAERIIRFSGSRDSNPRFP